MRPRIARVCSADDMSLCVHGSSVPQWYPDPRDLRLATAEAARAVSSWLSAAAAKGVSARESAPPHLTEHLSHRQKNSTNGVPGQTWGPISRLNVS